MFPRAFFVCVGLLLCAWLPVGCTFARRPATETGWIPAGAARVDITPLHPVRMMGYAARANIPAPTTAALPLYARALAIGEGDKAVVVVAIDNCILPGALTDEIRQRLEKRAGLPAAQVALTVTHTHSAPCLRGAAPNIFAKDMTEEDRVAIDRYTRWFLDRVEEAALKALADRSPSRVSWGEGRVGFAKNRRTSGGPVDHALPVLRVERQDGSLKALWTSYACHCTTLEGNFNEHHGDWAGVAGRQLEADHPGAVGLVSIGCGADANPDPRGTLALAEQHGKAVAAEVARLETQHLRSVTGTAVCTLKTIELPYQRHFIRAEWEQRATNSGIVGYHARKWLARLDRGEVVSPTLPYPVQTWRFGEDLGVVFLGGEVVVDYSLRLKSELDPSRLWLNGYANAVPCYIPSRRILQEGGYEAETSLWYYDRPQRLAPEIEDQIVKTVLDAFPSTWHRDPKQREFPPPTEPKQALQTFRYPASLELELVASEPLVESPVAIDFGADGRLWVCEMYDYPEGIDGKGGHGGRVKLLSDANGDGRFDMATLVAADLAFPTGIMAWGDGALVCAAPDVFYVKPRAGGTGWDRIPLLTGFATHNFQARVNGLRWGLDGWVYGSGGLFGGTVQVVGTTRGEPPDSRFASVPCSNRDFRWKPETGEFEALAGVSQQGRTRDAFGNWFGNDNSTLLWQFLLPERYSRRNPFIELPDARVGVNADGNRVYPASRTLTRFNDPQTANHLTSACSPEIYRDDWLGPEFVRNVFVCEPVHNLVRRAQLSRVGVPFTARRASGEEQSEFLASTDNWFRPVDVRTGPDGCLWIVDFYRFVLEHPRWIPAERLKMLDVRAGAERGRIYRLKRRGLAPRPVVNLRQTDLHGLLGTLRSPNGVVRDLVHQEFLRRSQKEPVAELLANTGEAASRTDSGAVVQRLALERQLGVLTQEKLDRVYHYADPEIRCAAIELSEPRDAVAKNGKVPETLLACVRNGDPAVRYQLALTLGEFTQPEAAAALASLARAGRADPHLRAAVSTAFHANPEAFITELSHGPDGPQALRAYLDPFLRTLVGAGDAKGVASLGRVLLDPARAAESAGDLLTWFNAVWPRETLRRSVLDALPGAVRTTLEQEHERLSRTAAERVLHAVDGEERLQALRFLGTSAESDPARRRDFLGLAGKSLEDPLRAEWSRVLGSVRSPDFAATALEFWPSFPVTMRGQFLSTLLERADRAGAVLQAVEKNVVAVGELTPAQRRQLRAHADRAVAQRAAALFPEPSKDRARLVADYARAGQLAADVARGAPVFDRLCANCHRVRGRGVAVGPDLTSFRGKPFGDFVTAILDPNAAIEPRYVGYTVDVKDGRALTGVVRNESSTSVTLGLPGGESPTVLRTQIERMGASPLSLMPEGLEQGLSAQDLADLVAWIKASPGAFGAATTAEIETSRNRFRAMRPSGFTQPESVQPPLSYPGWLGKLPLFYCRQTAGEQRLSWRSVVPEAVDGRVLFRWPVAMGLQSQPPGQFRFLVEGMEVFTFDVTLEEHAWTGRTGRGQARYTVLESNQEDSGGLLEVELGVDALKPGATVRFEVVGNAGTSQRWFGIYHLPGVN